MNQRNIQKVPLKIPFIFPSISPMVFQKVVGFPEVWSIELVGRSGDVATILDLSTERLAFFFFGGAKVAKVGMDEVGP